MGQRALTFLICCLLLSACSTKHYRKSADKEVAKIIAGKTPLVPNMDTNFTIEASALISLEELPVYNGVEDAFGQDRELERGARIISLEKALELAVKYNRNYQGEKEVLYLQALSLSLDRHRYTPIFVSNGRVSYAGVASGVDEIIERQSVGYAQGTSVSQLMRFGTRLALDFTSDFTRFISGGGQISDSRVAATLTQPLLRGGFRVAAEQLTQAERDMLYQLREFTLFRKEFSVTTAAAYYRVLQNRDSVLNSWRGLQSFRLNVEREKASAEVGQRSQAQLDQLRQEELKTESRWIAAVRSYRRSLDEFKIQLGLPSDARVVLDEKELEELKVIDPQITLSNAMEIALVSRLELDTRRDVVIDAERHIKVAANGFLPKLDAVAGVSAAGRSTSGFTSPDLKRYQWNAGLDFDLPIDRKGARNNYRAALIAGERAKRNLDLAIDNIRLAVTENWRGLDQAKRDYEISEIGVELAERRVEEQQLRQQFGQAQARDLIDAQNDLIASKNQRTAALVGHTIARLNFWREIGILFIKDNGQWEEGPVETNEK